MESAAHRKYEPVKAPCVALGSRGLSQTESGVETPGYEEGEVGVSMCMSYTQVDSRNSPKLY